MTKVAIIRIAGQQGLTRDKKDTLKMLNLHKKNTCVVLENSGTLVGMLTKIKDLVTWGEIDEPTFKSLVEKRGRMPGNKPVSSVDISTFSKDFISGKKKIKDVKGLKKFFRLNPPRKGYGRKGIKIPFSRGGALGDRKEKINDLIKRML